MANLGLATLKRAFVLAAAARAAVHTDTGLVRSVVEQAVAWVAAAESGTR